MDAVTYSDLRKNLKSYMDQVYDDREPLVITRQGRKNLVLLSIDDYNSMTETEYLLASPENARRLLRSLREARAGKVKRRKLLE